MACTEFALSLMHIYPVGVTVDARGFGLGLEIVHRLAQRLDWQVDRVTDNENVRTLIRLD